MSLFSLYHHKTYITFLISIVIMGIADFVKEKATTAYVTLPMILAGCDVSSTSNEDYVPGTLPPEGHLYGLGGVGLGFLVWGIKEHREGKKSSAKAYYSISGVIFAGVGVATYLFMTHR